MAGPTTLFQTGVHGSRPAANAGCVLYWCTTHEIIYRSDGSAWANWQDLSAFSGSGIAETLIDAKGDLIVGSAADTAARLAVGANGTLPRAASGETTGIKWGFGLYFPRRILATIDNANVTHNVNSTSYIAPAVSQFYHDWDAFPATHFKITGWGAASTAGQTITWQLTTQAAPTNPVSAAGDDIVFDDSASEVNSGWIAVSDAMSGDTLMALSRKGSDGTVDWVGRWLDIEFKIV